jgi:hypothetical protein
MRQKNHFIGSLSTMVTLVTALLLLIPATNLLACNWGSQGGADYVPQRRGIEQQQQQPQLSKRQPLNAAQAQQIVSQYVKPINPNLTIGKPNDAGAYFEINLLSKDGEIVQIIGVDKYTGRLEPLS